jgi:hypothetical protein
VIKNVTKIQGKIKIKKLGENLKNQLLVPEDFLTRRKV